MARKTKSVAKTRARSVAKSRESGAEPLDAPLADPPAKPVRSRRGKSAKSSGSGTPEQADVMPAPAAADRLTVPAEGQAPVAVASPPQQRPLPTLVPIVSRSFQSKPAGGNAPLLLNGHVAVKRCRHGWFMFNQNDKFVGKSLDLYGEWCEAELEILAPLLRPGRVVFDIGAFIGSHTVFFAQRVGPSGRVFAIEPQRHAFQMLCGNVALNALTNVTCFPCVAGKEAGWRNLGEVSQTVVANFGATPALIVPRGEPTRMMRIDDLELTRCDLMKIDVEGMEEEVLAGAEATIRRFKPVIYCENNRDDGPRTLLRQLNDLGYKAWWHFVNYYSPNNFFKCEENIFAPYFPETNILCVPKTANIVVKNLIEVQGIDDDWRKAIERTNKTTR